MVGRITSGFDNNKDISIFTVEEKESIMYLCGLMSPIL